MILRSSERGDSDHGGSTVVLYTFGQGTTTQGPTYLDLALPDDHIVNQRQQPLTANCPILAGRGHGRLSISTASIYLLFWVPLRPHTISVAGQVFTCENGPESVKRTTPGEGYHTSWGLVGRTLQTSLVVQMMRVANGGSARSEAKSLRSRRGYMAVTETMSYNDNIGTLPK